MQFSIVIPTYNNIEYLKICINSILNNSNFNHQIIVHINENLDNTQNFIEEKNIEYTISKKNLGLCSSVNLAATKAKFNYILYSHDDMYFCPNWDIYLKNEVSQLNTNLFYLSATMIEKNTGHIQFDCGDNFKKFNEKKLLSNLNNLNYYDYQGSHWAPHLIHKNTWDKIGGFSEEFNPGDASDPDLNMKLWNEGVRIFKGINKFRVYHFSSITMRKKHNLKLNNGKRTFLKKWGITSKFFIKHYLNGETYFKNKIISKRYDGPLHEPKKNFFYYFDLFLCKLNFFFKF